jgi:K+-sensing histidine kinase KdpD
MFQTILLAWEQAHTPAHALEVAQELANKYDAELVIGVLVPRSEAAATGAHALDIERPARVSIPYHHAAHDLAEFAHQHGFDLLVVGHHPPERTHRLFSHDIVREIIDQADIPVLVVGEDELPRPRADEP